MRPPPPPPTVPTDRAEAVARAARHLAQGLPVGRAWALEGMRPPRKPLGEIPDGAGPGEAWEREVIARAHAQAVARTMRPVLEAVDDGDVKTAKWLLERQSPEDFGSAPRQAAVAPRDDTPQGSVTLNIFADAARAGTLSRQDLLAAAWGAPALPEHPEPLGDVLDVQEPPARPDKAPAATRLTFKRRTPRDGAED